MPHSCMPHECVPHECVPRDGKRLQGAAGWRLDSGVKAYASYTVGQPPPAPQPFLVEVVDAAAGEQELNAKLPGLGPMLL